MHSSNILHFTESLFCYPNFTKYISTLQFYDFLQNNIKNTLYFIIYFVTLHSDSVPTYFRVTSDLPPTGVKKGENGSRKFRDLNAKIV